MSGDGMDREHSHIEGQLELFELPPQGPPAVRFIRAPREVVTVQVRGGLL